MASVYAKNATQVMYSDLLYTHPDGYTAMRKATQQDRLNALIKVYNPKDTLHICPWDDDNLWELILETPAKGDQEFISGLEWCRFGSALYKSAATRFVFHNSLTKEQRHSIHKISGKLFTTFTERKDGADILNVFTPKFD